jgi:hypothetical protein
MPVLINRSIPAGEGDGVTFDLEKLAHHIRIKRSKGGRSQSFPYMVDLFDRIVPRITGPVAACIVPDQDYIDLHWMWSGYIRVGSPIVNFIGEERHVALALWSLWQGLPFIAKGPCNRLCFMKGCVNPHHYSYPLEMVSPAPMTFSVDGDPGLMVAERMAAGAAEVSAALPPVIAEMYHIPAPSKPYSFVNGVIEAKDNSIESLHAARAAVRRQMNKEWTEEERLEWWISLRPEHKEAIKRQSPDYYAKMEAAASAVYQEPHK